MTCQQDREIESSIATLESIEQYQNDLVCDQVSMESEGQKIDYLQVRRLQDLEDQVGMEGLTFQDVKDAFSAVGRAAVAGGRGFMKFLDAVHRTIDTTYLVRTRHLRQRVQALSEGDGRVNKGRMERPKLAAALAVGGDIPANFDAYAEGMVEFSHRTSNSVIPDLASMSRQIGQRLEAKRWMGTEAFDAEVQEITKIIGSYRMPMQRYTDQDYRRLYPGNRSLFVNIKPSRPRREPSVEFTGSRKVIDGLSSTSVGINKRPDGVKGKANEGILQILNQEQMLELLVSAEKLLQEAVRVSKITKAYAKDKVPSTMSLLISGFASGVKRQFDDIWTAQDDGFDVIEGAHQGGNAVRHKPGKRNMLGGGVRSGDAFGMLSLEEPSMEAKGEVDPEARAQMAAWVSRYLKLSLIDHQLTSRALVLLLVGVARSYLDYVEESLDYYT